MSHFVDRENQTWDVSIGLMVARSLKQRLDLNVNSIFQEETLSSLADDIDQVMDIIWVCVERQAEQRQISFDVFFGKLMDSDTLEKAFDAFFDAVVEYLPEKKRPAAKKILETLRSVGNKTVDHALRMIDEIDVEQDSDKISRAIVNQLMIGQPSTSSVESSESTQAKAT